MSSIVKSIRLSDQVLARCYEASHILGFEPKLDNEAIRITLMIGLTKALGPNWQSEQADPQWINMIQGTVQSQGSQRLSSHDIAMRLGENRMSVPRVDGRPVPPTSPFHDIDAWAVIKGFSPDHQQIALRIWTNLENGHLTVDDQLSSPYPIDWLTAGMLTALCIHLLSDEQITKCAQIINDRASA